MPQRDTSYRQRRQAERMQDAEYRSAYERAAKEIEQVDDIIRRGRARYPVSAPKCPVCGGDSRTALFWSKAGMTYTLCAAHKSQARKQRRAARGTR